LLIVIVVIGILAMIAIPLYLSQRDKARDAAVKEGVWGIQNAVLTYATEHDGLYPDPSQVAHDGQVASYLDPWPDNPWTGAPMADADGYSPGDFHYDAWDGDVVASLAFVLPEFEHFGLLGWTSVEAQPFVVRPLESSVLFAGDLSSLDGYSILMGDWSAIGDALVPSTESWQNRLAFGDAEWTDVRIDVAATLAEGNGYGVYYRCDGEEAITGYCFQYDPGAGDRFIVRKVINGSETAPIASTRMPEGFEVYGASHQVSVEVVGAHHVISVDGEQVLDFDDDSFGSGMAGLRSWSQADVTFHNVEVSEAAGD